MILLFLLPDIWPITQIFKKLKDSISERSTEEINQLSTKADSDNFINVISTSQESMIL